jgi:hypothetical protein
LTTTTWSNFFYSELIGKTQLGCFDAQLANNNLAYLTTTTESQANLFGKHSSLFKKHGLQTKQYRIPDKSIWQTL